VVLEATRYSVVCGVWCVWCVYALRALKVSFWNLVLTLNRYVVGSATSFLVTDNVSRVLMPLLVCILSTLLNVQQQ
jgi:hypothetical protein